MTENSLKRLWVRFQEKKRELGKHADKEFFYHYSYGKLAGCKRILDIGCGVGTFLKLGNGKTFGVDHNLDSLLRAKEHCKRLACSNALQLPFKNSIFDGINCSHVLEHLVPRDAHKLLHEMNRVLKAGGIMAISTPILWHKFYEDFTHIKPYYPEAIMHYYGKNKAQTTKQSIDCVYEMEEIKWRYTKAPLEPIIFSKCITLSALSLLVAQLLYNRGFSKHVPSGYTMILRKVA